MNPFRKFYSFLCITAYKQSARILKHKKEMTDAQSKSCVIKTGKTIWYPSYKKYFYCDKTSGEGWFFRLKPLTDKGKYPVFFYLHGSGLNHAGENDMQMWEFCWLKKKLDKHPCHQVVVHCDFTYYDYACAYNTDEHSRVIEDIICYLEETYKNVDRSRLYIAGTSYGGYGTAYEVLRNPDKYAGAVSAMGFTHNERFPITEWWQKMNIAATLRKKISERFRERLFISRGQRMTIRAFQKEANFLQKSSRSTAVLLKQRFMMTVRIQSLRLFSKKRIGLNGCLKNKKSVDNQKGAVIVDGSLLCSKKENIDFDCYIL